MTIYNSAYIVDPILQDIMAMECSDQSGVMKKVANILEIPSATAQNWRYKNKVKAVPVAAVKRVISISKAPALLDYWAPPDMEIVEKAVSEPPTMDREKELLDVQLAAARFNETVYRVTAASRNGLSPQGRREIGQALINLRRQISEVMALAGKL